MRYCASFRQTVQTGPYDYEVVTRVKELRAGSKIQDILDFMAAHGVDKLENVTISALDSTPDF